MSLSVDAFPACFQYTSLVRTELAGKVFAGCQHVLRFKQKRFFVIRDGVSERENDTMMSKATQRESATLLSCETFSPSQHFSVAVLDGWRVGIAVLTPE